MRKFTPLLIASVILSTVPAVGQEAQEWFERGLADYAAGRYAQAVTHLSTAAQKEPFNDQAHYHLANALLRIGHTQRALQEYGSAYSCTQSEEVARNCLIVLRTYKQRVPERTTAHRLQQRSMMRAPTSQSVQQLNDLASQHSRATQRETESHSAGVQVFKESPENANGMRQAWDRWIEDYRIAFNTTLAQTMRGGRLSGKTRMVFSVDSSHHLRGRVLETNAPEYVTDSLLNTTRRMDGQSVLGFPSGAAIPGFNFTMTYSYSAPPLSDTSLTANMRNTNANLLSPNAQRGVAGSLGSQNVNGTLSSNQVSAQMRNSQTSASIGARGTAATLGTAGSLGAGEVAGIPLPQIDTNVSGLVLPQAKPVELKATPGRLDSPAKRKNR